MKILSKNIKLLFEYSNDGAECSNVEVIESDPYELVRSGAPICPDCQEEMVLDDECLISN